MVSISLKMRLERSLDSSQGYHLDSHVLFDAVLATLSSKATRFDTAESVDLVSKHSKLKDPAERRKGSHGAAVSLIIPVFTPTIPTSSARATRQAR